MSALKAIFTFKLGLETRDTFVLGTFLSHAVKKKKKNLPHVLEWPSLLFLLLVVVI